MEPGRSGEAVDRCLGVIREFVDHVRGHYSGTRRVAPRSRRPHAVPSRDGVRRRASRVRPRELGRGEARHRRAL